MAQPPTGDHLKAVEVRRVRKAYEQVADQLRALILEGTITPGHRLPNEQSFPCWGTSFACILLDLSLRWGVDRRNWENASDVRVFPKVTQDGCIAYS